MSDDSQPDHAARTHPNILQGYGRCGEMPTFLVPDPPASIQELIEPEVKQQALDVWRAVNLLMVAINHWQDWFRYLHMYGDANPAIAMTCSEIAHECVHVLCVNRVNVSPFDSESEEVIHNMLPLLHDEWSTGGETYEWDAQQDKMVVVQLQRWQDDDKFIQKYYGGRQGRCMSSNHLFGCAFGLRSLLKKFPATALRSGKKNSEAQTNQVISRITFDDATKTITFDGESFLCCDQPKGYQIVKLLWERQDKKTTREDIRNKIPGLRGTNAVSETIKKLPSKIVDCIRRGTQDGFWIALPEK